MYYTAVLIGVGFVWTFVLRKRREKRKENGK